MSLTLIVVRLIVLALPSISAAQTFTDPFTYCRAVGSVDTPDSQYVGARIPPRVAAALRVKPPDGFGYETIEWRCMNGRVFACNTTNDPTICMKAPWRSGERPNQSMIEECRKNPNGFLASHGRWTCRNGRPVVTADRYPVDARGYPSSAWIAVRP